MSSADGLWAVLLRKGLDLRDRYRRQEVSEHGLAVTTGHIESAMDDLLSGSYRTEANRRLAKHQRPRTAVAVHVSEVFPDVAHATNNVAERAMRPAVIARPGAATGPKPELRRRES